MLPRLKAVIRREYLERVRTRTFWFSTLLVPVFMAGVMIVPAWLAEKGAGSFTIAVLDLSGDLAGPVKERLASILEDEKNLEIELVPIDPGPDPEATRARIKREILEKRYDGLLVLPKGLPAEGEPTYTAPNVAAFRLLSVLERAVNDVLVSRRLTAQGLDPELVERLTKRVDLKTFKLGKTGGETRDEGQAFLLSYVLMFLIFMSLLAYGGHVMRGVLEEKQSRIVEVILGSVRPFELMLGKVLGIGSVGLTQFLIWSVVGFALAAPGVLATVGLAGMDLPSIPVSLMVFFVVFFVLGFLLYGTLFAAIGAAFDTDQDAQQFGAMVNMLLVVPIVLMILIVNQPDGTMSIAMSLIPFFSPIIMFLRMTLTAVPPVQVAASVGLLVAAILAVSWIAAKIYRVGILMSGSKPTLKDMIRWIREA